MPISSAAKKAQRQSIKAKRKNAKIKLALKTAIKTTNSKNLCQVFSTIDKAAKRHIIHKNKAARIKSRLAKKFGAKAADKKTTQKPTIKSVKKSKK